MIAHRGSLYRDALLLTWGSLNWALYVTTVHFLFMFQLVGFRTNQLKAGHWGKTRLVSDFASSKRRTATETRRQVR